MLFLTALIWREIFHADGACRSLEARSLGRGSGLLNGRQLSLGGQEALTLAPLCPVGKGDESNEHDDDDGPDCEWKAVR